MKKYKHVCPCCNNAIPKIYETKTITKHKKHKVKTKVIKTVIGEDWSGHADKCPKLKEFLYNTKPSTNEKTDTTIS